jgi:hypothetical protein
MIARRDERGDAGGVVDAQSVEAERVAEKREIRRGGVEHGGELARGPIKLQV